MFFSSIVVFTGTVRLGPPNVICKLPMCICVSTPVVTGLVQTPGQFEVAETLNGLCGEANLDVQMISAVSGGTTKRSIIYNFDSDASRAIPTYEDLLIRK
jgi:hypothetical protein